MKFFVILAILVPLIASANVVINEIAWMGSLPKAGESSTAASNNEWIELYNNGSEAVDLNGWALNAVDGQPAIALSGGIFANGFFLLERTDDETVLSVAADFVYTGALGNSGEKLELRNASGVIIDNVDASGGWQAGDNTTKETMQRTSVGGWITAAMTPASSNVNQGGSQAPTSDVGANSGVTIQPAVIQEPKRSFTVDAGDDIKTVAGAEVRFQGAAFGFTGEPLQDDAARYLWNFGDGVFFEGKNTNHIYRYPGTYRAALYVSSGQTSGSDVIEVVVGESSIAISEIAGMWIELVNESTAAVDLSSWQIRNGAGQIYSLPAHTIIGPTAFVVFSQETNGLFFGPVNPKAELRYANGVIADALSFVGTLLPEKSIIRDDEGNAMMGEQTPGKKNVFLKRETKNQKLNIKTTEQNLKISQINPNDKAQMPNQIQNQNDQSNTKLNAKPYTLNATSQQASLFSSNYFWLALSVSVGLIAGTVVLALRNVVLF